MRDVMYFKSGRSFLWSDAEILSLAEPELAVL